MSDDEVIMLAITPETYKFYYVMGFASEKDPKSFVDDAVEFIHASDTRGAAEMVFHHRAGWSEQEWETFTEGKLHEFLRVQTGCCLADNSSEGTACIERIIEKYFEREAGLFETSSRMLDFYRALSGEKKHYLDRRPWLMSTMTVMTLEYELAITMQRISVLALKAIEISARIQYAREVHTCARILLSGPDIMDAIEQDLHMLEGQEMDIVSESDKLNWLADRHQMVLQFQERMQNSKKRARDD
jgi:hypothetical protein